MADYIHVPAGAPAVPKLDVTVDEHDFRAGAQKLIKELRPHWKETDVKMKLFTDGITNKLIGCYVGEVMEDVVLVRIYGNKTELFVDRENEVKSFRVLHANKCAPHLYCTFNNGLCYEFMQGTALDPEHIRCPEMFRLIARQMAKYHTIHAHNGWVPKSNLWLKMGKYFSLVPTEFEDKTVNLRFKRDIPSPTQLKEEMAWMQNSLSDLGSPVVLCHNDLLCKNIIFNEKEGPAGESGSPVGQLLTPGAGVSLLILEKVELTCSIKSCLEQDSTLPGKVKFIDYEYTGYNHQAYDIGNHFNEFAGINDVDYSCYPDKSLQMEWLRAYLEAYKEYKTHSSEVSDKEVEVLYVQVNRFALASHFFWGLWALIQAKYSTIEFDFLGYAILRFYQYFKMKPEVMALNFPL